MYFVEIWNLGHALKVVRRFVSWSYLYNITPILHEVLTYGIDFLKENDNRNKV